MKHIFTPSLLIKYLYKETSASENLAIAEALRTDAELREAYLQMREAQAQLPRVTFRPAESTIRNILKYSRAAALEQQA